MSTAEPSHRTHPHPFPSRAVPTSAPAQFKFIAASAAAAIAVAQNPAQPRWCVRAQARPPRHPPRVIACLPPPRAAAHRPLPPPPLTPFRSHSFRRPQEFTATITHSDNVREARACRALRSRHRLHSPRLASPRLASVVGAAQHNHTDVTDTMFSVSNNAVQDSFTDPRGNKGLDLHDYQQRRDYVVIGNQCREQPERGSIQDRIPDLRRVTYNKTDTFNGQQVYGIPCDT